MKNVICAINSVFGFYISIIKSEIYKSLIKWASRDEINKFMFCVSDFVNVHIIFRRWGLLLG